MSATCGKISGLFSSTLVSMTTKNYSTFYYKNIAKSGIKNQ